MLKLLLLASSLLALASSQQLIRLNSLKGADEKNYLAVGKVYVSAYSDSTNVLSQIWLIKSDGTKASLNVIKDLKPTELNGESQGYQVDAGSYVTTSLTDNNLKNLKGVMFLSSPAQAQNANFHVFDVSKSLNIVLQARTDPASTILFLNTHYGTNPYQSSIISSWTQSPDSKAYMYPGIPSDAAEPAKTQIFSNPMLIEKTETYFQTVDKFSLTLEAFYFRMTKADGVHFRIEPGYYNIDGSTSGNYDTTGFYMKAVGSDDKTVTIKVKRDTTRSGSCGRNLFGNFPPGGNVEARTYEGATSFSESIPPQNFMLQWTTPWLLSNFEISSTNGKQGYYYLQYFMHQGPKTSGTTSRPIQNPTQKPNPNPDHIETTTKSSAGIQSLVSLAISFFVARHL